MNDTTTSGPGHHTAALLASMAHTRLELAALDLEAHVGASATALLMAMIGLVIALIALTFAGISVIVIFWDTHRMAAALGTTACFAILAGVLTWRARTRWKLRPPVFATVLHELERDRAALRAGA